MAKEEKIYVKEIIKRLYKIEAFRSDTGDEVEWDQSIPFPRGEGDFGHNEGLELETELDDSFILWDGDGAILSNELFEIYQDNKDKYEKIYIDMDTWDEYVCFPKIVGKRLETDEDFAIRIRKKEESKIAKQKEKEGRKKQREEKKRQKELAQLEELKNRYESV